MSDILKGNLLKNVVTRIDFDDLYEIDSSKLKSISKLCKERGLEYDTVRKLSSDDFGLNDPIVLRNIPIEYIEKTFCYSFFNEDVSFIVEVNNFFFRVIQTVDREKYNTYKDDHMQVFIDMFQILEIDIETIRRISVKKVDEVFFENLENMCKVIKPEIVQNNIFGEKQSWNSPNSGSTVIQNFIYDNQKINFRRKIDRLQIRKVIDGNVKDILAYCLYLEYEVYTREYNKDCNISENLCDLDKITKDLFLDTFTEDGKLIVQRGGDIGDVEYNGDL